MNEVKFSDLYIEPSKNGLSIKFIDDQAGYKIVNMKELFAFPVLTDNIEMRMVRLTANELNRFKLIKGDLLFGRRSLVFEGAGKSTLYIGNSENLIFESSIIRVRIDPAKACPEFLKYLFQSSYGKSKIWSIIGGTAVFGIRGSDLANLKFHIPSPTEQYKISSILSAYDKLIENNNHRIKLLEEMAEEIYKEWFVRLRFPGYEKVNVLNGLPEGWENGTIGDLVEFKKGKNITLDTVLEGNVPVVAGGLTPAYYHSVANTISPTITISASGANAGFVNLYYEDIWASDCSYLDTKSTDFLYYFYLTLKTRQIEVTSLQKGSAQPHVYPKDIMIMKMKKPSSDLIEKFEVLVVSFFGEIKILSQKKHFLQQIRDLLLPRLISGKLSVKHLVEDVEKSFSLAAEPKASYQTK
jgi:type I restriction enzyme S subunit